MPDVMLSYAREDAAIAGQLRSILSELGLIVWHDTADTRTGEAFEEAINRAIKRSGAMLYLVSRQSTTSKWCAHELSAACSQQKLILPMTLDETPLPWLVEPIHASRFDPFAAQLWQALLQTRTGRRARWRAQLRAWCVVFVLPLLTVLVATVWFAVSDQRRAVHGLFVALRPHAVRLERRAKDLGVAYGMYFAAEPPTRKALCEQLDNIDRYVTPYNEAILQLAAASTDLERSRRAVADRRAADLAGEVLSIMQGRFTRIQYDSNDALELTAAWRSVDRVHATHHSELVSGLELLKERWSLYGARTLELLSDGAAE